MTTEEALKIIDIAEVEWEYPMDYAIAFEKAKEALEKQNKYRWHKYPDEKPTEEKQYLCCCKASFNMTYFKCLRWSNDLSDVDEYDFDDCTGMCGFYYYDSEFGFCKSDCSYWKEIDWSDE